MFTTSSASLFETVIEAQFRKRLIQLSCAKVIASAIVTTRFGYCNSLVFLDETSLILPRVKMQEFCEHVTVLLKALHGLHAKGHNQFKMSKLSHLVELLTSAQPANPRTV